MISVFMFVVSVISTDFTSLLSAWHGSCPRSSGPRPSSPLAVSFISRFCALDLLWLLTFAQVDSGRGNTIRFVWAGNSRRKPPKSIKQCLKWDRPRLTSTKSRLPIVCHHVAVAECPPANYPQGNDITFSPNWSRSSMILILIAKDMGYFEC